MKVHIAGDSWGCGEWGLENTIVHKGLEQYFIDEGHSVTNTSFGGASLSQIAQQLQNTDSHDLNICFVTDPFRYMRPLRFWTSPSVEKLLISQNKRLQKFLSILNTCKKPIFLIGGLHKLFPQSITNYDNLHIWVDSFPELIHKDVIYPKIHVDGTFIKWLQGGKSKNNHRWKLVDRNVFNFILEEREKWNDIIRLGMYPDNHHPNRDAHYKLFKYCFKKIKLLNLL